MSSPPLELTAYILAVAALETSPHPLIIVRILLATVQSGYPRPDLDNWCPRHFIIALSLDVCRNLHPCAAKKKWRGPTVAVGTPAVR